LLFPIFHFKQDESSIEGASQTVLHKDHKPNYVKMTMLSFLRIEWKIRGIDVKGWTYGVVDCAAQNGDNNENDQNKNTKLILAYMQEGVE
jgi:hypothetical protein